MAASRWCRRWSRSSSAAVSWGVQDIVLGMAHRGRLNVLSQVMGKPHRAIFHEFKGGSSTPDDVEGSGDVKYHLGALVGPRVRRQQRSPFADRQPVAPGNRQSGGARQGARQAGSGGPLRRETEVVPLVSAPKVLPLLLHGDAAFAGQGVVAECFGLSGLRGHRTAGSIHFIINNQIGFTTNPPFSRSSPYPSDVAKMVEARHLPRAMAMIPSRWSTPPRWPSSSARSSTSRW
jgi:2-oxoglutarate dehydrogenase E1 component